MPRHEDYDWFMDSGGPKMQRDLPNPLHKLEEFVDLITAAINRDRSLGHSVTRSLGDEADVLDIEQDGLYGLRLKMGSGQIFLIRVGLEP